MSSRFVVDMDELDSLIFEDKFPAGAMGLGVGEHEVRSDEQVWEQDWVGAGLDDPDVDGDTDE